MQYQIACLSARTGYNPENTGITVVYAQSNTPDPPR
jgi:hypothetical protein